MSYQTSSKRSPLFCLLIGQKNTKVFWHQTKLRKSETLNSARATAQRRQTLSTRDRGYTARDHQYVKRLPATKYYNYTANEADEKREHRLPKFQQNVVNRIRNETEERQVYTKNYLLRCNDRKQRKNVKLTQGVSFQRTEDCRSASSPFTPIMCDMQGRVTFVNKILTEQIVSFKLTIFVQFPSQVKYIYVQQPYA